MPLADTSQNSSGVVGHGCGEVDLQELGVGLAVGGTVQDAVDKIEDGYLVWGALVRVRPSLWQALVELAVEVHPARLIEVLFVGVEVEGRRLSMLTLSSVSSRSPQERWLPECSRVVSRSVVEIHR